MANSSIIEGIGNDVLFIFTAFFLIMCVVVTYYARLAVRTIGRPATQETPAGPSGSRQNNSVSSATVDEQSTENSDPTPTSAVRGPDLQERGDSSFDDIPATRRSSDSDILRRDPSGDTHSEGLRRRGENRQGPDAESEDAQITVRVKFMENDRNFTVNPNITVGQLKRKCFPAEMEQGRRVRLIYSGRLLQDDNASLSSHGVNDFSVIHTQISEAGRPEHQQQVPIDDGDLDLSSMLVPLVTTILGFSWFGIAYYSHLFSASSTMILIIVTAVYAFILFAVT